MDNVSNSCDREFDVVLKANDGTRISAHKNVLSRSSLFFKSMFELCEADEEVADVVTVNAFLGSYLTQFVEYCYTKNVTIANMEVLIEMADLFPLDDAVIGTCLELMSKNLCVENIINFVIASERHGYNDLILSSMEFIDLFFDSMRTHDKFNEISVGTLETILKRDTLEISNEEFVFDAIIKWYKYDKRNRKSYLPDLLKLVRLSDVDRTFISSIFLDFVAAHDCVRVFKAASEFLSEDDNSIHKKSDSRLPDKLVAFDDSTIQFYVEKTKKWTQFKYVCDKSKAVAYEDRWMEKIEYFSLLYSDECLSGAKKIQLTTRQTISERLLNVFDVSKPKVVATAWREGDNSTLFVAVCDELIYGANSDHYPKALRCIQYSAKRNEWAILPKVYQYGIYFRLVWVEPYLYALGGATFASKIYSNTMDICRYNHTELIKSRTSIWNVTDTYWEKCSPSLLQELPINLNVYAGVGVVNGCIYLVGPPIQNMSTLQCFNPRKKSMKTVASLYVPSRKIENVKVCGTKRFLYYAVADDGESGDKTSQCQNRFFRYDPNESEGRNWRELDSFNSKVGDFQLVDVSNLG